mgnify:CR=1 FL=1
MYSPVVWCKGNGLYSNLYTPYVSNRLNVFFVFFLFFFEINVLDFFPDFFPGRFSVLQREQILLD